MLTATGIPGRACQTRRRTARTLSTITLLLGIAVGSPPGNSSSTPELWGYGVRACADYLRAVEAAESGKPTDYQRYEDWFTGFISGLNLALDYDVLDGAGITAAMQRARAHCVGKPGDDFFTATMTLVRP
jgi:hypothetical protein